MTNCPECGITHENCLPEYREARRARMRKRVYEAWLLVKPFLFFISAWAIGWLFASIHWK